MQDSQKPFKFITIDRLSENQIGIRWQLKEIDGPVAVFAAEAVGSSQPVLVADKIRGTEIIFQGKKQASVKYYYLVAGESKGVWVGERRIPMEGTVNFRDLGGYRSNNGQSIRWGLIFRGDSLQRASDSDLEVIRQLKIGEVYDFRRDEEVEKGPNRFPVGHDLIYNHLPVVHGEFNFISALERLKQNADDTIKEETIIKGYIENTINFAATWGRVIKRLSEEDCPPLYFHCTAGKDRTGICAALIMSALEMPRDVIMEDYLLSNPFIRVVWNRVQKMIAEQGIDPQKLAPFFSAPEYAMEATLDHIDKEFGSPLKFLQKKAGVEPEVLDALRSRILE